MKCKETFNPAHLNVHLHQLDFKFGTFSEPPLLNLKMRGDACMYKPSDAYAYKFKFHFILFSRSKY